MFSSAVKKLSLWYLAIIMALSIGFSVALYRISSKALENNANRPIVVSLSGIFLGPDIKTNPHDRLAQLKEDQRRLKLNLALFNLFVLLLGASASYILARRTLQPIEAALVTQSRFTADASHELRTPLTAMQTEIEVGLRNPHISKADALNLLKSNLEEVASLKTLSEGLLTLARTTAKEDNPITNVSLKKVIAEATLRYAKAAKAKKINIASSAKNLKVKANHDQLVQLLGILLDNAIKYSPPGSKVGVDAAKKDKRIHVSVSDEGPGIDKADLSHIFERFFRADSSRTKKGAHGYGLGLAIAKKIADLHHARIDVKSELGKGTTFTLSLPIS